MSNKTPQDKLAAALAEMKPVAKEATNPHFRSRYADLNAILAEVKPALQKHGLALLQPIEDGNVITRILEASSGAIVAESALPLSQGGTPQQKGSEITYFRRYTLQSLLAWEAEDDDGNTAAPPTPPPAPAQSDDNKPWLNDDSETYIKAMDYLRDQYESGNGEKALKATLAKLGATYKINKQLRAALELAAKTGMRPGGEVDA